MANVKVPLSIVRPIPAHELIRWVCTKNPFYVISAALFLVGLWISFGGSGRDVDNWALMSSLGGYTMLLAGAALLLVRYAKVWDDVRTVLLLVVLMFLATSVTFDEVFALDPGRGFIFYVVGLAFAIAVSEVVLRGIRLTLPAGFRLPYYLLLALFFLYPLALAPVLDQPHHEGLLWGLFGFSSAAGFVFLTLLPAIRRGPEYVRGNGSPWPWPLYPWSLFVFLGAAVPARAFLLCWSMHLVPNISQLVFGPYFLVPFGFAVAILLLELGIVSRHRPTLIAALSVPVGLAGLTLIGHRDDALYQSFLDLFRSRLGGDPLFWTVLGALGFYGYAWLRGVAGAWQALAGALMTLAVIGPRTMLDRELGPPQPLSLLLGSILPFAIGLVRRQTALCLVGLGLMVAAVTLIPIAGTTEETRLALAVHVALFAMLTLAMAFDDLYARALRIAGPAMIAGACFIVLFARPALPAGIPGWVLQAYPFVMSVALIAYGVWFTQTPGLIAAASVLTLWLATMLWRGYHALRQVVYGLDFLVLSLAVLGLAIGVSLAKARWLRRRENAANTLR